MEKEKSTCCCGCTFKTASLIIGSLEMIGGLLCFVAGLVMIIYVNADYRYHRSARYESNIMFGIILAAGAVYIAHSAILIHGTRKGRQGFLQCWIIIQVIALVLGAILAFVAAISVGHQVILISGSVALGIFYLFVVKSHRQELLDAKNDESSGKEVSFKEMKNKTYNNMNQTNMNDQKV